MNRPTPESFKRFLLNRLPVILTSTIYLLVAIPVINWTLSLVDVYNNVYAGPIEMAFVGLGMCTFALIYDRLYLLYKQPNNPYKFSQVVSYFLKLPADFIFRSDTLPEYWRLISSDGIGITFGLKTPIKKGNEHFSDGDSSQGLDLHVHFLKPENSDESWVVTVNHHYEGKPWFILPHRFAVAIFTPTVLHQVEKFFVDRGLTEFLVNEDGRKIDFNWNAKV